MDARDRSTRPAIDVIDAADMPAATAISKSLEGGTERQRNRHAHSLVAWLSWIVARLGDWNRFADRLRGYALARRTEAV